MKQYLDTLQTLVDTATSKDDRTGTGTIAKFGHVMRFNLANGFPLVTTKKIHVKSVIHELLWMLSGDTNIKYLKDNGVRIWNEWADENGDLGPVYGAQWRNWNGEGIDQIKNAMRELKDNPTSRRIIVNAWNPSVMPDNSKSFSENVANGKAALPPCHSFFQLYTEKLSFIERLELLHDAGASTAETSDEFAIRAAFITKNIPVYRLSLMMTQRSVDTFLGAPFNIAFYSLLLEMFAQQANMLAGEFVHSLGDYHIYNNHTEQVNEQLSRTPKKLPTVRLNSRVTSIFDYTYDDIQIQDYEYHPRIKAAVSV